jgi:hypothetical protein
VAICGKDTNGNAVLTNQHSGLDPPVVYRYMYVYVLICLAQSLSCIPMLLSFDIYPQFGFVCFWFCCRVNERGQWCDVDVFSPRGEEKRWD